MTCQYTDKLTDISSQLSNIHIHIHILSYTVSVYVDEEADRRAVEDDEFYVRFDEVSEDVNLYLMSEEGQKDLEVEVRRREALLMEDIELRDDMKTGEILKTRGIREAMMSIEKRKAAFEEGEPFVEHSLHSVAEAICKFSLRGGRKGVIEL